jgi:hypothetical protein
MDQDNAKQELQEKMHQDVASQQLSEDLKIKVP